MARPQPSRSLHGRRRVRAREAFGSFQDQSPVHIAPVPALSMEGSRGAARMSQEVADNNDCDGFSCSCAETPAPTQDGGTLNGEEMGVGRV